MSLSDSGPIRTETSRTNSVLRRTSSILEQRGFDASTYHTVLVISTLVGLLANFGGGWLATRWPIQRLTGVGMAVLAALCALPSRSFPCAHRLHTPYL